MSGTPTASPTVHVNHWSESQVADWLSTIGLSKYSKDFTNNGISGEVLVLLDDDALRDIGVATVGQRLSLLAAIYRLKLQFGIPIQEGDWVPKSLEHNDGFSSAAGVTSSPYLTSLLRQRDDRIRMLESHIYKLADYLSRFQQDFAGVCRHVGVKAPSAEAPISLVPHSRSGDLHGHSHTPSDGSAHSLSAFGSHSDATSSATSHPIDSPTGRNMPSVASPSRSGFASQASNNYHPGSGFKPPTLISGRTDANGTAPITPTTGQASASAQSAFAVNSGAEISPTQSTPSATPTTGVPTGGSSFSIHGPTGAISNNSPTRRNATGAHTSQPSSSLTSGFPTSATTTPASLKHAANAGSGSDGSRQAMTLGSTTKSGVNGGSSSSSSDNNPYKSFRVTLDDPCHKVLPAALKKYKIIDDWRMYALFICYGNTERCLSYDEKPLLLFQKLKENNQSPVFMLRHIRDVKSPIAIANAKAAAKKEQPTPKKGGVLRTDGRRVITGAPPAGAAISRVGSPQETGPATELPAQAKANKTYAVAIYPYVSERNDEFDVGVGDTFVVLNKAKGWWVVQRDTKGDGTGDVVYSVPNDDDGEIEQLRSVGSSGSDGTSYRAEIASGWVPAGCLLETSKPLKSIVAPANGGPLGRARSGSTSNSGPSTPTVATTAEAKRTEVARASIPPALITSTSTPGIMLMDYKSNEDNLDLRKDDRLRVFKRYNHWSYCVQEGEAHARGWVPSWYIGKLSSSGSASNSRDTQASKSSLSTGTKLSPTKLAGSGETGSAGAGAAPALADASLSSDTNEPQQSQQGQGTGAP